MAFQLATGIALLGGHWQPKLNEALRRPGFPVWRANPVTKRLPKGPPQTAKDRVLTLALQIAALSATGTRPAPALEPGLGVSNHVVPFAETLDAALLPGLVAAAGERILLIKTHAAPSAEWIAAYRAFAARGQVRAHVNHRDPRDTCLALMDAARISRERGVTEFTEFAQFDDAVAGVQRYLAEEALWGDLPHTLHLHYEICAFRTDEAMDAIKADLRLRCANDLVRHYALRLAHTQRNKAAPERHRTELDERRSARLTEAFGPYLREQGYLVE